MENILGFIDFLSDIQVVLYAVGVIVTCATFFFGIRGWGRRRYFRTFSRECLLISRNAPAYRDYQMRFLHYTPHTFTLVKSMEEKKNIPFRAFVKEIAEDRLVFVVGASGVGKSVFMQRLSFRFRRRFHRKGSKRNLEDYDVLFFKISHTSSLGAILDRIERKTEGEDYRYSVYIDGLDELPALDVLSGKSVVDQLVTELRKRELLSRCKRIVISLRPEILETGYSDLFVNLGNLDDVPRIWSVDKFSAAQTGRMFRTECRVAGVKRTEVRKRLSRILTLMKNEDCIFSLPFAVTWANDILDNFRDSELLKAHWYEIIGTIVEYDFSKREYPVYLNTIGCTQVENALSCEQFTHACIEFVLDLAAYMGTHRCRRVSRSAIEKAGGSEPFSRQILVSRRLLNYVEDSETGGEPVYEFVHNMIYWYALTAALLRPTCSVADRRRIYKSEKSARTMLPDLFAEGFYMQFREGLPYMCYNDFLGVLERGFLACTNVDLSRFLNLLPEETTVSVRTRAGTDVQLTRENIRDFVEDGYLALSGGAEALAILNLFEPETIRMLDLKECKASDFTPLARFSRIDVLQFPDSVDAEQAARIAEEAGIFVGRASVYAKNIAFLPSGTTEHIAAWSVRFPPRDAEMYHEVMLRKQEGLPIRLDFIAPAKEVKDVDYSDPRWRESFELSDEYFFSGRQAVRELFNSKTDTTMLTSKDSEYFKTFPEMLDYATRVVRYLFDLAGGYRAPEYELNLGRLHPDPESVDMVSNILHQVFELGDFPFCDGDALCFLGVAVRKMVAEDGLRVKQEDAEVERLRGAIRVLHFLGIKEEFACFMQAIGMIEKEIVAALNQRWGSERTLNVGVRAIQKLKGKKYYTGEETAATRQAIEKKYKIDLTDLFDGMMQIGEVLLPANGPMPELAFNLLDLSAEFGSPYGMYELAKCYEQGYGVEQNAARALELYRESADGFEGAQRAVERLTVKL